MVFISIWKFFNSTHPKLSHSDNYLSPSKDHLSPVENSNNELLPPVPYTTASTSIYDDIVLTETILFFHFSLHYLVHTIF